MTTPPPPAPPGAPSGATSDPPPPGGGPAPEDGGPRVTREELRDLGRLRRTIADRKVAGVAGGLARHLDVDPVILRVAFVVLVFFGGAGLLLYGGCWLLVPEEGAAEAPLHLDDRTRVVALAMVGVVAALALLGDAWGDVGFPWPWVLLGAVALVVLARRDRAAGHDPGHPTPPPPPPGAPGYGAGYGPGYVPGYGVPQGPAYGTAGPAGPTPRRRRGPLLFWFTLALAALGVGVLGLVDLGGADVPPAGYPAVVVAVCGLMLLVGAFYGRAGGLILVGLLAAGAMAATTAADKWDGTVLAERPTSAADVSPDYRVKAGRLELDLRRVDDLDALDGRTLHLHNDVGEVRVVVPPGLDVDVTAQVHGLGGIDLFGQQHGGVDVRRRVVDDGGPGELPRLGLDLEVSVGQVTVVRDDAGDAARSER